MLLAGSQWESSDRVVEWLCIAWSNTYCLCSHFIVTNKDCIPFPGGMRLLLLQGALRQDVGSADHLRLRQGGKQEEARPLQGRWTLLSLPRWHQVQGWPLRLNRYRALLRKCALGCMTTVSWIPSTSWRQSLLVCLRLRYTYTHAYPYLDVHTSGGETHETYAMIFHRTSNDQAGSTICTLLSGLPNPWTPQPLRSL